MAYTAAKDDSNMAHANMERPNGSAVDQDNLTDMARNAGQKLSGMLGGTYTNVSKTAETVTREIRNRPVQSTLIALGVGYVLASVFRR